MVNVAAYARVEGGLVGLLVGDAVGVPYEFRSPGELPPRAQLHMRPPPGFARSYANVPLGTWSDDGAQALCLAASLLECGEWNARDFGSRLLAWFREGYMAVDRKVFDVGIQTGEALGRLAEGIEPSGLSGERNNGNGSLMRVLPAALLHAGGPESLVRLAHEQSALTHAHRRAQVCCALYCLWARAEVAGRPHAWDAAVADMRAAYASREDCLVELEGTILAARDRTPEGTGYVVDSLLSARAACGERSFESIVQRAVAFGNDTDTTACLAGGIAGIRHGVKGIPGDWMRMLRGRDILDPLLAQVRGRFPR